MFTDMLNNPIAAGDLIVYPTASGSSAAEMNTAQISELIPLVEKPGTWLSTGGRSQTPWVRDDQQFKRDATEYYPPRSGTWRQPGPPIPEKCFVLRCRQRRADGTLADKVSFLKNIDRVVVITAIAGNL